MFRLFVSRTSPRRPRNATPEVVTLEKILSPSAITPFTNLGNQLAQQIDQHQKQDVQAQVDSSVSASSPGEESNAVNYVKIDNQAEGGDQTQTATNSSDQTTDSSLNGGTGDTLAAQVPLA